MAIQAWYAETENGERSEEIRAGVAQARANSKRLGRPRVDMDSSSYFPVQNACFTMPVRIRWTDWFSLIRYFAQFVRSP